VSSVQSVVYFFLEVAMSSELLELEKRALAELQACADESALRTWNTKYFGDSGEIKQALNAIGKVPKDQRAAYGKEANRVKEALTAAFETKQAAIKDEDIERSLSRECLDVTLPGRPIRRGRLHLATQTLREIYAIFADLGFQIFRSREVESDENNFELLNMPPHHPARDMWDTFHTTTPGVLLRTHTSPGQIHVMRESAPKPIRAILPGMCYRYEQITKRSEIMFYQVEGLVVGEGITMADLKGTIQALARRFFGQEREIRIRSSYFPFTEPSIEVDVSWPMTDPEAVSLTKGTGWLEIMGAGMVHPVVLKNGGYNPAKFSGFAFGMGPQRVAMLRYGIDDIREFWKNDLRFLQQF
jgi:phenylalanyl-tRNA synthetase alpha chain